MSGRRWTPEEDRVLRELYFDHFASEIAKIVGRPEHSVYSRASVLGLKSSPEKLSRAGRKTCNSPNSIATRFKKGSIPRNKGKKMPPEVYAILSRTMFRKGQRTWNHREVGSERVNADGYIEIKVAEPSKWRLKHRYVWEQAHGPIPPSHNVQFRDHNPLDCRLENLYLISKAAQLKTENSLWARYPKDLQKVIQLNGCIKRQITIAKRKRNGKQ